MNVDANNVLVFDKISFIKGKYRRHVIVYETFEKTIISQQKSYLVCVIRTHIIQ